MSEDTDVERGEDESGVLTGHRKVGKTRVRKRTKDQDVTDRRIGVRVPCVKYVRERLVALLDGRRGGDVVDLRRPS